MFELATAPRHLPSTNEEHHRDVPPPVLSTIGPEAGEECAEHVEWLSPSARRRDLPRWLVGVLRASRGRQAPVLRGTSGSSELYRDLLAAGLVSRCRRGVRVVSDATVEPGSRALERALPGLGARLTAVLARLLVRSAPPRGGLVRAVLR